MSDYSTTNARPILAFSADLSSIHLPTTADRPASDSIVNSRPVAAGEPTLAFSADLSAVHFPATADRTPTAATIEPTSALAFSADSSSIHLPDSDVSASGDVLADVDALTVHLPTIDWSITDLPLIDVSIATTSQPSHTQMPLGSERPTGSPPPTAVEALTAHLPLIDWSITDLPILGVSITTPPHPSPPAAAEHTPMPNGSERPTGAPPPTNASNVHRNWKRITPSSSRSRDVCVPDACEHITSAYVDWPNDKAQLFHSLRFT